MKPFLRSFFVLFLVSFVPFSYVQSQGNGNGNNATGACSISDILVQNVNIVGTVNGRCVATFNVAFTLDANPGNKFVFIQTYIQSATRNGQAVTNPNTYPDYFKCQNRQSNVKFSPERGDVINPALNTDPLLNIAIDNNGTTPVFTTYVPDPTLPIEGVVQGSGITSFTLTNGATRFFLSNLQVELPYDCNSGTQYVFITDIFSSQANNARPLNCVDCGIVTPIGAVTLGGRINCNQINGVNTPVIDGILTNNTSNPVTVNYSFFSDVNDNRILTRTAVGGQDVLISEGSVTIAANSNATVSQILNGNFSTFRDQSAFLVVSVGGALLAQYLPTVECIPPLPVTFKSFTAKRNAKDNVGLSWETATESNNKGFQVQRNTGGGWTNVSFVNSKANGGNSNGTLAYEFTDINTEKGLTQYRLMQVDIDGRMKVSDIRSVRGEAQQNKVMIFPNPTNEGAVNILFDDSKGNRDVMISDMTGRIVKMYRSVSTTTMRVDNLNAGVYTIRITNQADGMQTIEKLVVNK